MTPKYARKVFLLDPWKFCGIQLRADLRPADLQRTILSEGYCAVRAGLRDDGASRSPLGEEIGPVLAGDGLAGAAQIGNHGLQRFIGKW